MDSEKSGRNKAVRGKHPPPAPIGQVDGAPSAEPRTAVRDQNSELSEKLDRELVGWTRALAVFTAALVIAAGLQFWVMRGQLDEMTATRISGDKGSADQLRALLAQSAAMQGQLDEMRNAQRAWAIASDVTIAIPETGKPYELITKLMNTGHLPAQDAHIYFGFAVKDIRPALIPHMGDGGDLFWQDCGKIPPKSGATILYPGDYSYVHFGGPAWTKDLQSGIDTLIWNVCLAYRTEGQVHHSAACFFYRSGVGSTSHLSRCQGGDYAN